MLLDVRGLKPTESVGAIVDALKNLNVGEVLEVISDQPFEDFVTALRKADYEVTLKEHAGSSILILKIKKLQNSKEVEVQKESDEKREDHPLEITEDTNVAKLLKSYPDALDILVKYGFKPLKNPILRRTLAKTMTLRRAQKLIGMDEKEFGKMMDELGALERKKS